MNKNTKFRILNAKCDASDFLTLQTSIDKRFSMGKDGVVHILGTRDGKVEYIFFKQHVLGLVKSALGYFAYYPVYPAHIEKPVKAILMDLDGTSVKSEDFWIWIIQLSTASMLGNPKFELQEKDIPYVSGHSVSEHLQYCIREYCPDKTLQEARNYYFEHTHREMQAIIDGYGRVDAFIPTPGLKDFLLELKSKRIKIGLVTSGLYEKAWPEILSAFRHLGLGDPEEFYDAIITAGYPMRNGQPGTLGELSPKPHPWLYSEICSVGLGIPFHERHHVIGVEDSGAGINAIRLAGFSAIGLSGGNIVDSGALDLCDAFCQSLNEISAIIDQLT